MLINMKQGRRNKGLGGYSPPRICEKQYTGGGIYTLTKKYDIPSHRSTSSIYGAHLHSRSHSRSLHPHYSCLCYEHTCNHNGVRNIRFSHALTLFALLLTLQYILEHSLPFTLHSHSHSQYSKKVIFYCIFFQK